MNPSHMAICANVMYSFGLCACSIEPGPQMIDGIPALWKRPASVAYAARLTAAAFAVVGDFEDAIYCWRTQAGAWPDRNLGIVLAAGAGALGVKLGMPLSEVEGLYARSELGLGEPADAPFLDSAVGLLWRALVLWVFVLIVITLARVF